FGCRRLGLAPVDDREVLDDNRAGPGDALDVAAGDSGLDFALVHRADRPPNRQPLGGAPNVIEPICTFSAPATPCTTPPLMLNWILATASPPTPCAFICSSSCRSACATSGSSAAFAAVTFSSRSAACALELGSSSTAVIAFAIGAPSPQLPSITTLSP